MLSLAILLAAALAGDPAKAADSYEAGMRLFEKAQWEKAVEAFDAALKEVPNENDNLSYRAQGIIVRLKYHPHAQSGLAMLRLAEASLVLPEKKQRLDAAISRLVRSERADAKEALPKARKSLEEVEAKLKDKPPGPAPADPFPAILARVKGQVDGLNQAERYEEALDVVATAQGFAGHDAEKRDLSEQIRTKQTLAVTTRATILDLEMERIGSGRPLETLASHLQTLEKAKVPPAVQRETAPKFRLLDDFLDACGKQRGTLDKAAEADERSVCESAQAFDQVAARALEAGYLPGFQAARNVGHSLRLARMTALPSARLEAGDKWDRAVQLDAAAEDSRKKADELLRAGLGKVTDPALKENIAKYLAETAPAQRGTLAAELAKIARPGTVKRIQQAEKGLQSREVVADADRLRGIGTDLAALQNDAEFSKLSVADQARALFAAAAARAVSGFLDGEERDRILGDCSALAAKAYALDGNVDAAWRDQLSPKILSLLAESRKR